MQTLNRDSVLKLYERLTGLIEKLPGSIQKPILRELVPIRELFLEQRPPRILLVGAAERVSVPALLHDFCGAPVETGDAVDGWRTYRLADRGAVEILDARASAPDDFFEAGLRARKPDVILFSRDGSIGDAELERVLDQAAARVGQCDAPDAPRPGMAGLAIGDDADSARAKLDACLHARREFAQRNLRVFAAAPGRWPAIAETVCELLPNPAKLEFARMTDATGAQHRIASSLLKSFTAVCGVIGVQPIPLADLPILTTLQTLMVGLIVYTSGRHASARLIAEFVGALGINVGMGFAFREGARALVKFFPVWGNALSGIVAGAGTYAVGRAAIAYFIDDLPLRDTKKLFARLQPGIESFRTRMLHPGRRKENSATRPG